MDKITVTQVAYHRNGSVGEGFHAVTFTEGRGPTKRSYVATVFDGPGQVAVLGVDLLDSHGVTFGENSYRGDRYERSLRHAIKDYEGRFDSVGDAEYVAALTARWPAGPAVYSDQGRLAVVSSRGRNG